MKYVKKINIDFNNWEEIEDFNKFIIFRSGKYYYIGYIIVDYGEYKIILYDKEYPKYNIDVINSIMDIYPNDIIKYNLDNGVNFVDLDRNKIIVVGIDCTKRELLDNIDKYVVENKEYNIKDILKKH